MGRRSENDEAENRADHSGCFIGADGHCYLFGRLSDSTPLYITCLVLLGIETVIWLIWGRCPHCHALIWRQHGDYCQMCGKNLYEEDER